MVGIFKANNPLNTFVLFTYGLALKFAFFINASVPVTKKSDGFLFRELMIQLKIAGTGLPFIYPLLAYLLLFTQAVTFNRLINDQRLIQRSTYLPAMSYLLITSMFPEWNMLTPALVINTLLIWVMGKIYNLYNSPNPKATLFNIGMVIGISAFLYFPSLAFALLIIFALIMNRPFNPAEWVIALVGIITPFYFLFVYLFLTDKLNGHDLPGLAIGYPTFSKNYWPLAAILLVLTAFLTGAYFVRENITRQVVQVRKGWNIIVIYLVVATLITFLNDSHSFEYGILTGIPFSAFIGSAFFYPPKKWVPVLLHWLMAGFVIAFSYFLQ